MVNEITKAFFRIGSHNEIIPTIYKAYDIAISGEPGPVFIEIPMELQMFKGKVDQLLPYTKSFQNPTFDKQKIKAAAELLVQAKNPGIYVGWGASMATEYTKNIADVLGAPVATTLQGKASFPASHPLHTGFGFGPNAVPASQKAFKNCDAMLAVGVRFSEIATGSFGVTVPENLIHIDINPQVFDKNYPSKISIEADATEALKEMVEALKKAQKDMEDQKPKKGKPGKPGDPPLIDMLAEVKMIRALQMRVNKRTKRYSKMIDGEQADSAELFDALQRLAEREERIHRVTRDLQLGKNK